MSFNLLTAIQQKLPMPAFAKVSPNTQELGTKDEEASPQDKLLQAVTTSTLAAIYEASKSEKGIDLIANLPLHNEWASALFGENKTQVLENISRYASYDPIHAESKINEIAEVAIGIVREQVSKDEAQKNTEIKNLLSNQRDNILPYLPAALQMGYILHDNSIDDRTNKMEGPISSLMNKLQSSFGGSETQEEADSKQQINK
jgi:hypothetical protein